MRGGAPRGSLRAARSLLKAWCEMVNRQERLMLLTTCVLVVAAGITSTLAYRHLHRPRTAAAALAIVPANRSVADLEETPLWIGPHSASLVVAVFSDFQCPFCARAAASIDTVLARHKDEVAIVFRHYPLERLHRYAFAAALAGECAAAQGAFARIHVLLFESQSQFARTPWTSLSRQAGASDTTAFARCVHDPATERRVRADMALGDSVGIRATPTFVIGRERFDGAPSVRFLDSLVTARLQQTSGGAHE
jgi:protein-disulfide isomerase